MTGTTKHGNVEAYDDCEGDGYQVFNHATLGQK